MKAPKSTSKTLPINDLRNSSSSNYRPNSLTALELEALNGRLNEAIGRNKEATVEIGNLENALERASVKASKMEDAEKRASEANLKIIALQHELSRLEKIESRFEGQKELVSTLQDQGKTLKEQNALLSKKADELSAALNDARVEASHKVSALQAELSRLEKTEARSGEQIKGLQEQNAALIEKADLLGKEFKEASIKIARLETKAELQDKRK